jgi:sigma-54 dependent transcriptional regulator, acetoin dehydrogenase operon transcriptional activator AcoR
MTASSHVIPNSDALKKEITASHQRCRQFGINTLNIGNRNQVKLSPIALNDRLKSLEDFFAVVSSQIQALYNLVADLGFSVQIVDSDGYILDVIGDEATLIALREDNCSPGYRWTEKDVGTTAISVAIARKLPIQINADEHFRQISHQYTCSACPIFGPEKDLIGIIALTGSAAAVHPHTLGMVIMTAKAVEGQMELIRSAEELLLRNNYMNAIIESIDSGVMAVNRNGVISQTNNKGKEILRWERKIEGNPLSSLMGNQINWRHVLDNGFGYHDREAFIRTPKGEIHIINTAKPIFDASGKIHGVIIVFNEINRIRKLVDRMAGTQARFTFEDIIGESTHIQKAKKLAMSAAMGRATVLLAGETGTGKELFAQSIHNQSQSKNHPFIAINCGAIPRELLESELFGYAEGAFTGALKDGRPGKFELADGGTILLDEIGDMPSDMQVKLLRVLQTGEVCRIGEHRSIQVSVRIIAATNKDLKSLVDKGNFRDDLFYRLNVFPILIPPLRERGRDIILLARHVLNRCTRVINKPEICFSPETEQRLLEYHWPGNVRELENVVERAVNITEGNFIGPELLGFSKESAKTTPVTTEQPFLLSKIEENTISAALQKMEFNVSKTAEALGITRATLYKKMIRYGIIHR